MKAVSCQQTVNFCDVKSCHTTKSQYNNLPHLILYNLTTLFHRINIFLKKDAFVLKITKLRNCLSETSIIFGLSKDPKIFSKRVLIDFVQFKVTTEKKFCRCRKQQPGGANLLHVAPFGKIVSFITIYYIAVQQLYEKI